MLKEHPLLPLFQKFIKYSRNGKRLNKDGSRTKPQTVANYEYCYKLLEGFSIDKTIPLIIYEIRGNDKREHSKLKKHWNGFYKNFTDYLYQEKGCLIIMLGKLSR